MFEITENGQVLKVEEIQTKTQVAVMRSHYSFKDKVAIFSDKTIIQAGDDVSSVTFVWQAFDVMDGVHKDNTVNNTLITAKINDQEVELIPENGRAELEFSSDEPGIYEITTTALETDTIIVEVV